MTYALRVAACLAGFLFWCGSGCAASISYTVAGSMPAAMPSTSVSEPGADFLLAFTVPLPAAALPGTIPGGFDVAIPTAALAFGGQTVQLNVILLEFFDDADGGGLVLEGTHGADDLTVSLISPQLFTGDLGAPTLITGVFAVDSTDSYTYLQLGGELGPVYAPLGPTSVTAVPEPGGAALLSLGLSFLYRRRRSHITSEYTRLSSRHVASGK